MQPFTVASSRQLRQLCRNSTRLEQNALGALQHYTTTTSTPTPARRTRRSQAPQFASSSHTQPQARHASTRSASTSPETSTPTSSPASPPKTHYDFFPKTLPLGPPPSGPFPIDIRALRREFLQLQAQAHPDKHPPHLKSRAEATSARINEAYKCLQSPLLRAQYLLELQGIDVANDETLKIEDPGTLMLVMEVREEIENAGEETELVGLREENEERIRASEGVLEEAFKAGDVVRAKEEAVRLRYWVNVRESLDSWEKGKGVVLEH